MFKIKKEAANILEYKAHNNAHIVNFVCLWKTWYVLPLIKL